MIREQEFIKLINKRIRKIKDVQAKEDAYQHLFGVSHTARMIALHRGLDSELLAVAGLLHDLITYEKGIEANHARLGATYVRKILKDFKYYKKKEIDMICTAILYHSAKKAKHSKFDEALKDADCLQHFLSEPWKKYPEPKAKRVKKVSKELRLHIPDLQIK